MDFESRLNLAGEARSLTAEFVFLLYGADGRQGAADGALSIALDRQAVWSDLQVRCQEFERMFTLSTPRRVVFGWRLGPETHDWPSDFPRVLEARFRPKLGPTLEVRRDLRR